MNQTMPTIAKPNVPIVNGQLAPQDFDGLYRVAEIMSQSGLVPTAYNNQPAKIFVAVQMGMELGLGPMASLQNIAVINGNPSVWGDAVLGIVSGSNLLEDFKEEESGTYPNEDYKYICSAKRKGRETPIVREFSIADAKQAGLFDGNKDNWKKYPKRMIQMRARSRTLRDGFPDLLKGIKVAEEVMDYELDLKPSKNGTFEVKPSVSERLNDKPDMSIYGSKPKINEVPEEPKLSEDIQNQINDSFEIDSRLAKAALIEIGRDSIDGITDDKTAETYLKKFNELVSQSDNE